MELATAEAHFQTLDRTIPDQDDYDLALRHAPRIRFDVREPFVPLAAGYTVFRGSQDSPSFPRRMVLQAPVSTVIEYAIWWDWDIQHLYEVEHIWVYLDADEQVVAADASWHGGYHVMTDAAGNVPIDEGRVTLFSEPGKHAFAPLREWLLERRPTTDESCTRRSGKGGVWVTPLFKGIIHDRTNLNNNLVRAYLEKRAFDPTYDFSNIFDLRDAALVPWNTLFEWIPKRVNWWALHMAQTIPPAERRPLRIAHRGASAYAQEGSQASVEKAAELGADMIEIDIRVTADDVPVVAHDASLKRIFDVEGSISEMTLDAIQAATPAGRQPILTFEEMLRLCGSLHLGLYLDLKEVTPGALATIIALLREQDMLKYSVFGSFRPDLVAEIKAAAPDATTSILFASTHIDPVALAAGVGADCVHPCWERFDSPAALLTEAWIEQVRAAGLDIICWHEERPPVIAALRALGVDGICSDQPELLP